MKIFKSKIFWIIIAIILIGGIALYRYDQQKNLPQYITAKVEQGTLTQSVSATGKVQSATETNLNFKISGKLALLMVQVGDNVEAGRLIARLEAGQQQSAVENYRAQLLEAQANLDKVIAGASSEDIAVSLAKVNQAASDLSSKETTLDNLTIERDQTILTYKESALDSINESIFYAEESLEDIDEFLYNGSYLDFLNTYTVSYTAAKNNYQTANTEVVDLNADFNNYSINNSTTEIINSLEEVDDILMEVETALDGTYTLLSVLSPGGNITQTVIDSNKTTITADQTNINSSINEVQSAKSNLQLKVVYYDNSIKDAEQDVEKAISALAVAQAELELKQVSPKSYDIEAAEARVKTAEAKLQSALVDLADYNLTSPINGIITKTTYKIGEFVSTANPAITLIGESNKEIEIDVPESDIAKVKVGDQAEITLDAFGDERVFTSHIVFIDPAETVISEVVYYKVKLIFDEQDENIKSGMTANVVITTGKKDDVLYIPARAVIEPNGDRYVKVLSNGQVSERKVQTGMRGDGGLIEITEGLTKGEEVITYVKNGK